MDDLAVDAFVCGAVPFEALPENRPAWLKPYAFVTGKVESAPLDLPQRLDEATRKLQQAGWTVVVKSVGTDFGPIPVPKSQPLELYLHRTDRPYTEKDAQSALGTALRSLNMAYSATGAWAGEIATHVVVPTIMQAAEQAKSAANMTARLLPFVAVGLVALAAIIYLPKPSR